MFEVENTFIFYSLKITKITVKKDILIGEMNFLKRLMLLNFSSLYLLCQAFYYMKFHQIIKVN